MVIGSNSSDVGARLSNFHGRRFIFDGVECHSFEGFLQSLKFSNPEMQKEICKLVGYGAKKRGKSKKWFRLQELYWNGVIYKRKSKEYQELLDRVYQAVYDQDEDFRNDIAKCTTFTHPYGSNNESETVLTRQEFCGRLKTLHDTGKLYYKGKYKI